MSFKTIALGLAALASAGSAGATNLIVNGSFEQLTSTAAQGQYHLCDNTQSGCVSALVGWSATSATDGPFSTSSPGSVLLGGNGGAEFNSSIGLYGPIPNSPDGGNFLGLDGDTQFSQTISQTITGLTIGQGYTVTFYQSAGQQNGLSGATTEQWEVAFGEQAHQFSTNQFSDSQSFLPWTKQTLHFTADAIADTLTFISHGTPGGEPPVALLDGVSLTADVPEPASWALMVVGFGVVGVAARRRTVVAA